MLEPHYSKIKSKPTLPSINPSDGSIGSFCLCVYLGMYLWAWTYEKSVERSKYICGALDFHREMHCHHWILKTGLHVNVLRFPYLAMGHFSLRDVIIFIMVIEIELNFLFSVAACSSSLQLGGKNWRWFFWPTIPHPVHKHRSYL